ncbi:unnamed protein product [Leptosia nina]|uniref:Alcohol dehydrogenase n=1 Tax=Leptosia nina TaxID=320188 RepID=A0AAV1JDB7_9NEOP
MSKEIKDTVVVVTGGANGIGLDISEKFLQKKCRTVIILDLNDDQGKKAVKSLNSQYGNNKAVFFQCDISKDIDVIWDKIVNCYNKVDILINNAGVVNENEPREAINVNLTAVIELSFKFWETNRNDGSGNGGTIINLASLYGVIIEPFLPVYQATKFGIIAFTRSLGHSFNYERSGVRVVAVCPGLTNTELANTVSQKAWDKRIISDFSARTKEHPWQNVDAVGRATIEVFEKAMTGTAWIINGGEPIKEVMF